MRLAWTAAAAAALAACASGEPDWPLAGPPEPRQPRPPQIWEPPPPAPDTAKRPQEAHAMHVYVKLMLERHRVDCGLYPTTAEGLHALYRAPAGRARWRGPYLEGEPPLLDPWGRDFVYRSDGATFVLLSAGEDGVAGTPDDIGGNE